MSRRFWVLLAALVVLGVIWTIWFTQTCSASNGSQWWCWLG